MLERGQGLYFTPKRARKFKVETVCNLFPGPQQGTNVAMVPQPHMQDPGVTPPHTASSGFANPAKGRCQDNPSASQIISVHQIQHTYTPEGWQALKKANPPPYLGDAAWTASAVLSKRDSHKHIF